jgi:hypothetical protein
MAQCIISGCNNIAQHNFSVRCRRPDTSAIWAPNTNAFLCDTHAEQGCVIDISITPNQSNQITTNISSGGNDVVTRTTDINHEADE